MTAPRGVVRAAIATRRGEHPSLIGTNAVTRHCRRCGRLVLAGWDAPVMAGLAVVDPYAATWRDEAAAVILARPTWRLLGPWPTRGELTPRHQPGLPDYGIRQPLADPDNRILVVIAHQCGTPPVAHRPLPTKSAETKYPNTPPF